jgi:hypothetical protein
VIFILIEGAWLHPFLKGLFAHELRNEVVYRWDLRVAQQVSANLAAPLGKKGSARFVIKLPSKLRKNVARDVNAKPGPGRH